MTVNLKNVLLFKVTFEGDESAALFPNNHGTFSPLIIESCGILYNIGSSMIFVSSYTFFDTFFDC